MTTCLILAAGEAERHNGGNKPLLEVNGETLLNRTWRLCEGHKRWVVTHRSDLVPLQDSECPEWTGFSPSARRWVVETLLSSFDIWSNLDETVVLLGDVFYTESAMEKIFETKTTAAFGKGCEVHALRIQTEDYGKVVNGLRRSISDAEARPRTRGAGKLWLFVECNRIPLIDFGDETTDFDSPQEHKRFIAKYVNRNLRTTEASKAR